MKNLKLLSIVLIGMILITNQSFSQTFKRKSIESFENTKCNLWGLTAIDYNSDGHLDLLGTDIQGSERLFRNNGNGEFTLIKVENGGLDGGGRESGISWGDFDNDGDPDPVIGTQTGLNHLYKNDEKGFLPLSNNIEVVDTLRSYDAVWVDYDNDGNLDLFASNVQSFGVKERPGTYSYLFHNNGKGEFKKVITDVVSKDEGNSTTGSFADFDNDGDLDIFVVNGLYTEKDALYKNNGDGTFTRILEGPLVNNPAGGWNAAWGDIDNDGDEDVYVSTWSTINLFYMNNGDGTFTKNDTELIVSDSDSISTATSIWADFDNDGDLDFITANCTDSKNIYYENIGNENNWISIKLDGTVSNRSAIGAQIRLKATINGKEVQQMREISASNGFRMLNNGFRAHFGLGNADKIESIEVRWPSGKKTNIENAEINQFLIITE